MTPTLKELPLGPEIPRAKAKAGLTPIAPDGVKDGAGGLAGGGREVFGALVDGLPVKGASLSLDTETAGAQALKPDVMPRNARRTPDWADAQLDAAATVKSASASTETDTQVPDVARASNVIDGDGESLVQSPVALVARRVEADRPSVSPESNRQSSDDLAPKTANNSNDFDPVAAEVSATARDISRGIEPRGVETGSTSSEADRVEVPAAVSLSSAASQTPSTAQSSQVSTGRAPASDSEAPTPAPAPARREVSGDTDPQGAEPDQPSNAPDTATVSEVSSFSSAPPATAPGAADTAAQAMPAVGPATPTTVTETVALRQAQGALDTPNAIPASAISPASTGILTAAGTAAKTVATEAEMPGTTGSTAARASAEVAQTAVPSDAAAQAESTARRDHAAEREPRAGTAILNTTTDRSGTAAPVATTSPAPQAFAASPTASGAATAPPSFASAEIAARLAEGDAEKLAQGLAPAGDAEIALTPLRADRDAEFRAVLRQAPAAPVPAANLAREVMQAAISAKGSGSIELRIDPVELGKLDIEFSVVDDRMNIIVRADREEALDLMRRNSDDLQKMLREAGVDLGSLSFSQGGSRDPQQEHRFGVSGAGGDSAVSGGPASTLPPVQSSERLDIRV